MPGRPGRGRDRADGHRRARPGAPAPAAPRRAPLFRTRRPPAARCVLSDATRRRRTGSTPGPRAACCAARSTTCSRTAPKPRTGTRCAAAAEDPRHAPRRPSGAAPCPDRSGLDLARRRFACGWGSPARQLLPGPAAAITAAEYRALWPAGMAAGGPLWLVPPGTAASGSRDGAEPDPGLGDGGAAAAAAAAEK